MMIGWSRSVPVGDDEMDGGGSKARFGVAVGAMLVVFMALSFVGCDDDAPRLTPVEGCETDQECEAADDRYDRCAWVCEAQATYCKVSCEQDADCRDRGLPNEYVFCDIPRPGDGFCNQHDFDYAADACVQDVPPTDPSEREPAMP